jgi:hypothetical protein
LQQQQTATDQPATTHTNTTTPTPNTPARIIMAGGQFFEPIRIIGDVVPYALLVENTTASTGKKKTYYSVEKRALKAIRKMTGDQAIKALVRLLHEIVSVEYDVFFPDQTLMERYHMGRSSLIPSLAIFPEFMNHFVGCFQSCHNLDLDYFTRTHSEFPSPASFQGCATCSGMRNTSTTSC